MLLLVIGAHKKASGHAGTYLLMMIVVRGPGDYSFIHGAPHNGARLAHGRQFANIEKYENTFGFRNSYSTIPDPAFHPAVPVRLREGAVQGCSELAVWP